MPVEEHNRSRSTGQRRRIYLHPPKHSYLTFYVLLGSGELTSGRISAAFTAACLQTHLASRQESMQ